MLIHLLDFIKTGKFGTVQIGQSVEEIRKIFPEPDDENRMHKGMYIWRYSSFEFHFADGFLYLLWCDNLPWLSAPRSQQFKWNFWIVKRLIKQRRVITLHKFLKSIKQHNIPYTLKGCFNKDTILPDMATVYINGTNAIIHFENFTEKAASIYDYELAAIGATEPRQIERERVL